MNQLFTMHSRSQNGDKFPLFIVPNQLVGAPSGTDVTIDCHTEAHPR
jgi:hypothetical protein